MKNILLAAIFLSATLVLISCKGKKEEPEETGITFKIKKGEGGIELKMNGLEKSDQEEK
jgi:hypothetical protein